MDKNHRPMLRKDKIGLAEKVLAVDPKPES